MAIISEAGVVRRVQVKRNAILIAIAASVRRHRRAQGDRSTLRSIRPTRATAKQVRFLSLDSYDGRPKFMICGAARDVAHERGIGEILVSISHCRAYATAYALAVSRPAR